MRHFGRWAAAGLVFVTAVTACGSSGSPERSRSSSTSIPPVATEAALAKQALISAAELGAPWVEPKSGVSTASGKKGEACPGQPSAETLNKPRASASENLTEGTKQGAAIGTFEVRTIEPGTEQAWRDTFAAVTKGCATSTSTDGTFSTWDVVGAPAVPGSDEVLARIERIYSDKSKSKLLYVRQSYEARAGRVISALSYAFIQPASDPTGGDLTKSAALLTRQVTKSGITFKR